MRGRGRERNEKKKKKALEHSNEADSLLRTVWAGIPSCAMATDPMSTFGKIKAGAKGWPVPPTAWAKWVLQVEAHGPGHTDGMGRGTQGTQGLEDLHSIPGDIHVCHVPVPQPQLCSSVTKL